MENYHVYTFPERCIFFELYNMLDSIKLDNHQYIILDFNKTQIMDSAFIGYLLNIQHTYDMDSGKDCIMDFSLRALKFLKILGVHKFFLKLEEQ